MATKTFKGKYPGIDRFKGDEDLRAAYRRLKAKRPNLSRKQLVNRTIRQSKKPTPKPNPDASLAPNTGLPSSNASSNSSGNIQLQTNADIEGAVLDAEEDLKLAESQATELEQQAEITRAVQQESLRRAGLDWRGRTNASNAYRGLRGTSALRKSAEVESEITSQGNSISEYYRQQRENARMQRENARGRRAAVDTWANRARQEYTNERSRLNPTVGSSPVNSGVKPTNPGSEGIKKVGSPPKIGAPKKKTTTKKKFKGKYPGPDRFKGDMKKVRAYRAAKRKAGR